MLNRCVLMAVGSVAVMAVSFFAGAVAQSAGDSQNGEECVFELRTYTTEDGRLDALHKRFRDHTARLFEKHGMKNIGYWTPTDEPRSNDTLIYVLAHASHEAAEKSWDGFINDPEWHKVRDASEADGKIVKKIESIYMNPTDYSAIR